MYILPGIHIFLYFVIFSRYIFACLEVSPFLDSLHRVEVTPDNLVIQFGTVSETVIPPLWLFLLQETVRLQPM
jgi:hypothetical protein